MRTARQEFRLKLERRPLYLQGTAGGDARRTAAGTAALPSRCSEHTTYYFPRPPAILNAMPPAISTTLMMGDTRSL